MAAATPSELAREDRVLPMDDDNATAAPLIAEHDIPQRISSQKRPAHLNINDSYEDTARKASVTSPTFSLQSPGLSMVSADIPDFGTTILFDLLFAATGARYRYALTEEHLSEKTLSKLPLNEVMDPSAISVYKFKELLLGQWQDGQFLQQNSKYRRLTSVLIGWGEKPAAPSSLRLIYFGKLLGNNAALGGMHAPIVLIMRVLTNVQLEHNFRRNGTANVMHVSVKPADFPDDEEGGKGKGAASIDAAGSRCRCCIMM